MFDYHIHTTIRDGVHSIEENVEYAIFKGLNEIGISEHFGILPDDWENYMKNIDMYEPEWEELKLKKTAPFSMRGALFRYFNFIDLAKEKYKDQIIVKKGLEMDLYRSNYKKSFDLVKSFKPDYIIGSIHAFDQIGFHNFPTYKTVTSEDYKKLLNELIFFVKNDCMNILGHFNLYKCFIDFGDEKEFYPLYEELILACKEHNVVPEVNTGLFGGKFIMDPNMFFLKTCGKYDVPVMISSDAHNKYNIADSYKIMFPYLKKAGIKYTAKWIDCKAEIREIDYDRALGFKWFPQYFVVW